MYTERRHKSMDTIDRRWVIVTQIYNLHWLNNLREEATLAAIRLGEFESRCEIYVIAVNIYSSCECNMDFICTNCAPGLGASFSIDLLNCLNSAASGIAGCV